MAIPTSPTAETATARSSHVSDPSLQPFLQSTFDPADYFNTTLASLSISSVSRPLKQTQSASLADLSSQTQDLLSQLNAHTTRLSAILTQLTDDILRSGGRLAYEVEVLRGEAIGLTETLTDGLKDDVKTFLPDGLPQEPMDNDADHDDEPNASSENEPSSQDNPPQPKPLSSNTPEHIAHLRTLTLVRTRLESIIQIFGDAMAWPLAPSDLSLPSSLISVSAPAISSSTSTPTDEARARDFAANLRAEISDLITGAQDPGAGAEAAAARIQALRDLAVVWRGTAEEKARVKFVEGLVKLAEEKQRAVEEKAGQKQRGARSGSAVKAQTAQPGKGVGFLDNLQRYI